MEAQCVYQVKTLRYFCSVGAERSLGLSRGLLDQDFAQQAVQLRLYPDQPRELKVFIREQQGCCKNTADCFCGEWAHGKKKSGS